MKRVAIYLRVSTSKQDTDNQRPRVGGGGREIRLEGFKGLRGCWHQRR
jgi:DNA invertase Pin-like site-specific DNA recombinase